MNPDLSVQIGNLKLKNPVIVASGTFGYGEEFSEIYDISKLGAVVTKGIFLKARSGNPMPRIAETASGMLNAIGLPGIGVDAFVSEKLPILERAGATVIVNVCGSSVGEYAEVAGNLDGVRSVAAVEVNISCPNIKEGGIQFGTDPELAAEVTRAVRKRFSRAVIVKLSPKCSDIPAMAKAIADSGADALSLINSIPAMAIDVKTKRPMLANTIGGLSGPAIKPIALRMVWEAAGAVEVPIIGIGGIMTTEDAVEFLLAGASAVQVGTANFVRPNAAPEIIDGLVAYCKEGALRSIKELVGGLRLD